MLLAVLLAGACGGGGLDLAEMMTDAEGNLLHHEMIVLGDRLEDPYSVEAMTRAFAALYPTKADRVTLPATDLYVRFLPADEDEFEVLAALGLPLLDHPVDYEILREGDYYHDPELDPDRITWQYSVVPKDFVFPAGIRCEILERCHIPSEGDPTKAGDGVDWAAVEQEAFRQTGNGALLERGRGGPGTRASSSGTPAGRITIVDAALGAEPEGVRGVRVSCNSFVKFAHAYTDEQGNYRMTRSFSSRPRYRIVFSNSAGFSIGLNLLLVPASASTLGKNDADGLDVEITQQSDRKLFSRCVVNNAGYDYVKRCRAESPAVKTPPGNLRLWLFQGLEASCTMMLQQGVLVDGSKLAEFLGEFSVLLKIFLPDVALGLKGKDGYGEIYAEATHAFAHASHFMQAGKSWWNDYVRYLLTSFVSSGFVDYGVGTEENFGLCEVGEMWAFFAQTLIWRERYGDTGEAFGVSHWFHPQILLQLEERGLAWSRIFQVLTSDVTDRESFRKKLVSYYPEHKSTINQVFARYN